MHEVRATYSLTKWIVDLKNRALKEIMNVMLLILGLSDNMWEETYLLAIFLVEHPIRS